MFKELGRIPGPFPPEPSSTCILSRGTIDNAVASCTVIASPIGSPAHKTYKTRAGDMVVVVSSDGASEIGTKIQAGTTIRHSHNHAFPADRRDC